MKFGKFNSTYVVRLEKGEEVIKTLTEFCESNGINSGSIYGIGGANNVSLRYYDLDKRGYVSKKFTGKNYEIVSLNGNISTLDNRPFLHIHTIISDSEYRTFGGHLESAVISVTCEIFVSPINGVINRKPDNEFGLNFMDL